VRANGQAEQQLVEVPRFHRRVHDQGATVELGDVGRLTAAGERVRRGHREEQPLGLDDARKQAGPGDRRPHEAEVEVTRGDRLHLVGGYQLAQHEIQMR
jgi:hypothetical protein